VQCWRSRRVRRRRGRRVDVVLRSRRLAQKVVDDLLLNALKVNTNKIKSVFVHLLFLSITDAAQALRCGYFMYPPRNG
jgi:hypothetical protein